MTALKECKNTYQNGDNFFEEEHKRWIGLEQQLKSLGYTYEETVELKNYYRKLCSEISQKEKAVVDEVDLSQMSLFDTVKDDDAKVLEDIIEKEKIIETVKQPVR